MCKNTKNSPIAALLKLLKAIKMSNTLCSSLCDKACFCFAKDSRVARLVTQPVQAVMSARL